MSTKQEKSAAAWFGPRRLMAHEQDEANEATKRAREASDAREARGRMLARLWDLVPIEARAEIERARYASAAEIEASMSAALVASFFPADANPGDWAHPLWLAGACGAAPGAWSVSLRHDHVLMRLEVLPARPDLQVPGISLFRRYPREGARVGRVE